MIALIVLTFLSVCSIMSLGILLLFNFRYASLRPNKMQAIQMYRDHNHSTHVTEQYYDATLRTALDRDLKTWLTTTINLSMLCLVTWSGIWAELLSWLTTVSLGLSLSPWLSSLAVSVTSLSIVWLGLRLAQTIILYLCSQSRWQSFIETKPSVHFLTGQELTASAWRWLAFMVTIITMVTIVDLLGSSLWWVIPLVIWIVLTALNGFENFIIQKASTVSPLPSTHPTAKAMQDLAHQLGYPIYQIVVKATDCKTNRCITQRISLGGFLPKVPIMLDDDLFSALSPHQITALFAREIYLTRRWYKTIMIPLLITIFVGLVLWLSLMLVTHTDLIPYLSLNSNNPASQIFIIYWIFCLMKKFDKTPTSIAMKLVMQCYEAAADTFAAKVTSPALIQDSLLSLTSTHAWLLVHHKFYAATQHRRPMVIRINRLSSL